MDQWSSHRITSTAAGVRIRQDPTIPTPSKPEMMAINEKISS